MVLVISPLLQLVLYMGGNVIIDLGGELTTSIVLMFGFTLFSYVSYKIIAFLLENKGE